MKKENTLLIFSPSIEDGGVEKNLYNISNYLSKKLNKTFLLTANLDKKKNFNKIINYVSPNSNFWNNSSRTIKSIVCIFLFFFKLNIKKNNLVILSFNSNIYAIIIAKIVGAKIIIRSNTSPNAYLNNFFKKTLFKFCFSISDEIIVNSFDFKKQIKSYFNLKSTCILNPLENIEIIKKLSKKSIKLNLFKKNSLNIISVGRLVKQKNHLIILKAMKILSKKINCKLLIIGNGEEKSNLLSFIKKNKLKNVKIINFKKNPYPYIKSSNLFILSSLYEGLPNVLLEAMALKKNIIASDCPTGPREILQNGKFGELYKNNDLNDLIKRIKKFKKTSKINKIKVDLAYKSLIRFSFDRRCGDYLKLLSKYI